MVQIKETLSEVRDITIEIEQISDIANCLLDDDVYTKEQAAQELLELVKIKSNRLFTILGADPF